MKSLLKKSLCTKTKQFIAKMLVFVLVAGSISITPAMNAEAATAVTTTYEAEDGTVCDVSHARKIHESTSNASGGKSATLYSEEYITYSVSVSDAGTYDVKMIYAGNTASGTCPDEIPLQITVGNGTPTGHNVECPKDYNTFLEYDFTVELAAGVNAIVIKNVSDNTKLFANIDYITVTKHLEEIVTTYEAEDGTVCDVSHARKIHESTSNASGGKSATLYSEEYITYSVSVSDAGVCDVKMRYAGNTASGTCPAEIPLEITVGSGAPTVHNVECPKDYNVFLDYKISVELAKGINTIVIKNVSDNTKLFANIDNITVVENPKGEEVEPVGPTFPAVGSVEAEDTLVKNGTIKSTASFSGGKYLEAMNENIGNDMSALRKYLTYNLDASEAGYYKVTLDYATESAVTKFGVKVNDGDWHFRYVESTGAWNRLGVEEYVIELQEGINTITVTGSLDAGWIILDRFTMEKTDQAPSADPLAPIESHEPEEGEVKKTAKQLQDEALVSFRGRNMNIEDAVTFDYSASGFEFNFNGEGDIRANFTVTASEKFAVDVDGVVTYHSVTAGNVSIYLAEDLAAGAHTIKVYKTQEAMTGLAQLNYMTYDEDAVLAPIKTDYNFLIIGASSTAGNQIDPVSGAEDGYLSFSSLVSRAYNATWQQVSCSGRGVVQGTRGEDNWAFSQEGMLAEMYKAQSWFRDKETAYDPTSFTPDVIITNFNNDFAGGTRAQGYDYDEIYEKMFEFVSELRASYPNAYIALTYGNFPTFEADGTYNSPTVIAGYYAAAEAYRQETGDTMVEYVELPCLAGGKSNHSNWEEHEYIAEILSDRISKALNIENPLPITRFEFEDGELVNAGDTGVINSTLDWASSVSKHSGNTWVTGMDVDLAGAAVAADGSNVKYVSVPITVAKDGIYQIEVNYGTYNAATLQLRANGGDWNEIVLSSTTDWNKIGQNANFTVFLEAGENVIDVTGATNGYQVWLDRLDTVFVRSESAAETEIRLAKATLKELIAEVEALNEEDYTADTWKKLTDALSIARLTLSNKNVTLAEVQRYSTDLQTAKNALIDKNALVAITFNAQGGSACASTSKNIGVAYGTLPTTTKKGYTFNGWYTAATGGTKITATSKVAAAQSITLYAQWTAAKYTIKYNLNGGKNASNPASYTVATNTITLKNPTKKGYTFGGWYSDKKLTKKVTQIKKGSTGNVTLYAKWTANKYTIKFNKNGGKGTVKAVSATYDKKVRLTKNSFTRKGYKFTGWSTKKTGKVAYKNRAYVKNLTDKKNGSITLYAQWKAEEYTIKYNLNGGKNNAGNPKKYTVAKAVKLKAPTKKGYKFGGWYSDKKLTKKVTQIKKGSTGKVTLYAKWIAQ